MFTPEKRTISKFEREPIRVTDQHIQGIMKWITERDIQILRLLLDHPFLTTEQIERMVFTNLTPSSWRSKTNDRINRLYHAHCVDRWFPPAGEGEGSKQQHIVLDRAGAMVLARHLGYNPKQMKWHKRVHIPQNYQHTLKIFDFKSLLHVLNRQLGVVLNSATGEEEGAVGEVLRFYQENQCRMQFPYKDAHEKVKQMLIIPDALVFYRYNPTRLKVFFIEFDNATEDIEELESKIKRYILCHRVGKWKEETWAQQTGGRFPPVLFLVHEDELAKHLRGYSAKFKSNIRFLFSTYAQLISEEYRIFPNNQNRHRKILQSIKVNLLEPIWLSSSESGQVCL